MRKEKTNYVYIPDMGRPAYDKQVRTNTGSPTAQSAARDLLSYNNLLFVEFGTISIQISIQSHRFIMHKYCCMHVIINLWGCTEILCIGQIEASTCPPRATPRAFNFFENYCSNSPLPGPKCRSNAPH